MNRPDSLDALLAESAVRHPDRVAVEDAAGDRLTYADLDGRATVLAEQLRSVGLVAGDRVGICARKSLATVVSIFGALRAGAAYVPVDPTSPAARNAYIFEDCFVRAALVDEALFPALDDAAAAGGGCLTTAGALDPSGKDDPCIAIAMADRGAGPDTQPCGDEVAYILYTSGSTGKPKGVVHSRATARSFIDWCSSAFAPVPEDRFSSHAPFHFDLSILDLYVPIKHGASVLLIDEDLGKQPMGLAPLIQERGLTVWYSTPSILRLLVEFGHLETHQCPSLRLVLFAGEVFPVKHLRALQERWRHPRYCNLYGPTETNVCTWYDAPNPLPSERTVPLPIGVACSGDELLLIDEQDRPVAKGEEGELLVAGGSVMLGYWNLPDRNATAFHVDDSGIHWYRTGDIVREESDGNITYVSRRDRMVKRRGFRVELGEIESVLYRHPEIAEAAVIALPDEEAGVHLRAFLSWNGDGKPSQIALKGFASKNLPGYMIPDRFIVLDTLPKTSTDKTDYQALKEIG